MQDADYSKRLRRTKIKKNANRSGHHGQHSLWRSAWSTAVGERCTHPRGTVYKRLRRGGRLFFVLRGVVGRMQRNPGERP